MKIAIYGRAFSEEFTPYVQHLFDKLDELGSKLMIYQPFRQYLANRISLPDSEEFSTHSDIRDKVDVLVSIGGDGTFLDATKYVRDAQIPILGVNTGRLGFLSSVRLDEMDEAFHALVDKEYTLDKRELIKLTTENNLFGEDNFALNEVTVQKRDSASMVTIHTYIDGEFLTSYWADGLIIATPTGSTAYSMAAGGPIVMPGSENFVLTPLAPHNLTVRPIVVPASSEIKLKIEGRSSSYLVALDSRSATIEPSTELIITRNNFYINLVRLKNHSYLRTVRNKLNWGLDQRN